MAILNKSPLKILEKMERGRIQGLSRFFGYPLLSRERVKLLTSNLASTFTAPMRIKAHKKFGERERGRIHTRAAQIFGYPLLSQERVKLWTSNFVRTFTGSIGTKAHEKF